MNKAKIVAHNGAIFGCPNCDYIFQYDYSTVPTDIPTYKVCEKCNEALLVNPVTIKVKFKKCTLDKEPKKKRNKPKYCKMNKAIDEARAIVKTYSFSVKQFDNAFKRIEGLYESGWQPISTEELVRQILARIDNKDEQPTT